MKNSAVEALVRAQFNIDKSTYIHIEFIAYVDSVYEFFIEWYDVDIRYYSTVHLPRIIYDSEDMLGD